jgi:ribulose-phosphate 3-epimerase
MTSARVAASLMAADLTRLGDEVRAMEAARVDAFHWDIMDGHFVPNLTFGPDAVKKLRPITQLFFDVHLMVDKPDKWIGPFVDAGANAITFHVEAVDNPESLIDKIKEYGIEAGLAYCPETDIDESARYLSKLDRILIMTVSPGFGGQNFMDMRNKIKKASIIRENARHLEITVDGGINDNTAKICRTAGATTLVSGSHLFGQKDYTLAVSTLRGDAA